MTNWEVTTGDGHYIGRHSARKAEMAFRECMELLGTQMDTADIDAEEIGEGIRRINFEGVVYILTGTLAP